MPAIHGDIWIQESYGGNKASSHEIEDKPVACYRLPGVFKIVIGGRPSSLNAIRTRDAGNNLGKYLDVFLGCKKRFPFINGLTIIVGDEQADEKKQESAGETHNVGINVFKIDFH
jgi:hypothetical protein